MQIEAANKTGHTYVCAIKEGQVITESAAKANTHNPNTQSKCMPYTFIQFHSRSSGAHVQNTKLQNPKTNVPDPIAIFDFD